MCFTGFTIDSIPPCLDRIKLKLPDGIIDHIAAGVPNQCCPGSTHSNHGLLLNQRQLCATQSYAEVSFDSLVVLEEGMAEKRDVKTFSFTIMPVGETSLRCDFSVLVLQQNRKISLLKRQAAGTEAQCSNQKQLRAVW